MSCHWSNQLGCRKGRQSGGRVPEREAELRDGAGKGAEWRPGAGKGGRVAEVCRKWRLSGGRVPETEAEWRKGAGKRSLVCAGHEH